MKLLNLLAIFALTTAFVSCNDDDDHETLLAEKDIPTQIMSYKNEHFPSNAIRRAIKDTEGKTTNYELYLDGNFELDFNEKYEIYDIEGTTKLPDSVIPQAILDYTAENYSANYIIGWELELGHQQVELNNKLDLEFSLDGTFIRVDND